MPDTVRIVEDTAALPPDTVRETTVVEVQRALLDTGMFRAFEVNFAFGESTLLPRAARSLDVVGEVLTRYPNLRVEIAGHTDAVGAADYNRTLAERRAESVRRYLVRRSGIDAQRLDAKGYGEAQPIATNETAAGRALNRRVEFVVLNPAAAFLRAEGRNPSNEPAANEAGQDLETMIRRAIQEELERQQAAPPDTTGSGP
jgi:outer membrane protein OmpA-like peptidoglycan-associated protein